MNTPQYIMNVDNITIMNDGTPIQIIRGNANFQRVRKAILDNDFDTATTLIKASTQIRQTVEALSGNVEVKDGKVHYRGYPLDSTIARSVIGMINEGITNLVPWLKHIELLMANPNSKSQEELYDFLAYKGLPIDEDGYVFAYKGVKENGWSSSGNTNTVVLKGQVNGQGQIFNGIGEEIEVARGSVDGERENNCSFGLHVGSFDYAKGWAGHSGKLLLVKFSPTDAVSVPTDCSCQKLRVCRYIVVKEIERENSEITRSFHDENATVGSNIESEINEYFKEVGVNIEDYVYDYELMDDLDAYGYWNPNWNESEFAEVFEEMSSTVVDEEVEDSERDKIARYSGRYATTAQIQKNLGITGLTCARIAQIADDLGMLVDNRGGAVSKWIVS